MSQFDQTTEAKAKDFAPTGSGMNYHGGPGWWTEDMRKGFTAGRNSTKASMEILARALKDVAYKHPECFCMDQVGIAEQAIAQVKANGDWPLEEKIF